MRALISNLREQGATVFLTTHYLEEADILCDRIAILVQGKIEQIGTPEAFKALAQDEPITEFSFDGETTQFVQSLADMLPELKVVAANHNKVRIHGGILTHVYHTVFQFAEDKGIQIKRVNTIEPSLEDAFIKITGLSPMIMAVEKGK